MSTVDVSPLDGRLAPARAIADAVLYEGYVLYPYRASSAKNRFRWQWGMVGPPAAHAAGVGEEPAMHADLLVRGDEATTVDLRLRFLQVQTRDVETVAGERLSHLTAGEQTHVSFDEAVEVHLDVTGLSVAELLDRTHRSLVDTQGGEHVEAVPGASGHRIARRRQPVRGSLEISAHPTAAKEVWRIRAAVENTSAWDGGDRDAASRRSMIGTHVLAASPGGSFVSVLEPPDWAGEAVQECAHHRLWPVLVGARQTGPLVLASPVILYDAPVVAPESSGDFFDGTEIDELLTLRVQTMTPEEKAEAAATDPRAAAIIERCDAASPEEMARLHGAIRDSGGAELPWWDPASDESLSPGTDQVLVAGVPVSRGTQVRVRPGRRADAHDIFYAGRSATVRAVVHDVDGSVHVAVTFDDDPAAELYDSTGRYLYFSTEELEPLEAEGR